MFASLIAALGPVGLTAAFLLLAAAAGAATVHYIRRSRDTVFSTVHPGKKHVGGCKFDSRVVNATRFAPTPPIDISNLPQPDPRILAAFKTIKPEDLKAKVEMISGERDITIGGKAQVITARYPVP